MIEIDDDFKFDLREMLDIAVEAKRAYWDANRDVELMFEEGYDGLPDVVSNRIEEAISTLAAGSGEIGSEEVEFFLDQLRSHMGKENKT